MNTVLFSFKRIFHKSVQFGKALLGDFGLTPARFDMLHVIFLSSGDKIRQKQLGQILGVTRSTVSVMLQSLCALGLVVRQRVTVGGRRQFEIMLTAGGRARIGAAMLAMFDEERCVRETQKRVLLRPASELHKNIGAWQKVDTELAHIRRNFGDHSAMHYGWTARHRATALAYVAAA